MEERALETDSRGVVVSILDPFPSADRNTFHDIVDCRETGATGES